MKVVLRPDAERQIKQGENKDRIKTRRAGLHVWDTHVQEEGPTLGMRQACSTMQHAICDSTCEKNKDPKSGTHGAQVSAVHTNPSIQTTPRLWTNAGLTNRERHYAEYQPEERDYTKEAQLIDVKRAV